jgi:hypothetical protein
MHRKKPIEPHKLSRDSTRPEHAIETAKLQLVRGAIVAQAERVSLPARFEVVLAVDRPQGIITDLETGRQAPVPLYALGAVCKLLQALFG